MATYEDFRTIYANLFAGSTEDIAIRLRKLRKGLFDFQRERPTDTRALADQMLTELNDRKDPQMSTRQLSALKRVLDWRELEGIAPIKFNQDYPASVLAFYQRAIEDWSAIEPIQQLLYEYSTYKTSENRASALRALRAFAPTVDWGDTELDALVYLLVIDVRFKLLAPYPIPDDCW